MMIRIGRVRDGPPSFNFMLLVAVAFTSGATITEAQQSPQLTLLRLPARATVPTTGVFTPPLVWPRADTLSPMTLRIAFSTEQSGHEASRLHQTILRTTDRVLVATDGSRTEWLFERNPVDPRRVTGYLIDHDARRVLVHEESDLRNGQQIRGWMDVLTLRFDADSLQSLQNTGEMKTEGGVLFQRYRQPSARAEGVTEVWWSEDLLLPLSLLTRQGLIRTTLRIEAIEGDVDRRRLENPVRRLPDYEIRDISDAREDRNPK